MAQHVVAQQHSRLMSPLDKARAQVHVEEVKKGVAGQEQVRAQASAPLPVAPTEIIIPADPHGKAAHRHIAVTSPMQRPIFPEALPITA